ncbi:IF-2B-domain-containing protein [Piedraia hortae CBS 480.64]|uniref:Translation initiation factor eIF2B subunit delta n=1 Tax=Piedraia hortae CBS 480.64 TaxID=1314780 RepID=A0A6A7C6Q0_9PEZI|nr:IF-2B-domain-containing protein [Piedraia hortae CBS 480.64]
MADAIEAIAEKAAALTIESTAEPKLTPAELKKQKKAEKQARRAADKEQTGAKAESAPAEQTPRKASIPAEKKPSKPPEKPKPEKAPPKQAPKQTEAEKPAPKSQPCERSQVEIFSHLFAQPRRSGLENTHKDVHPAVQQLGLQMSSYEVCGSSARCEGMLKAFKRLVQAYETPAGQSLPRNLTHSLGPQIEFLKSCRPISESMGNAIRHLKKLVVNVDPSMEEHAAKEYICEEIDRFIHERIYVTDAAISAQAAGQIKDGMTVLIYAKSAVVTQTLLKAHESGRRFHVIVIDSEPLHEGKASACKLTAAGVEVSCFTYASAGSVMSKVDLVLFGAHSMLGNGALMSRIGTAAIAMHAHGKNVPVIVCCESVKFSGKVALDSVAYNEAADPESFGDVKEDGCQVLNLMYDVTPEEFVTMVTCELGNVPPRAVPAMHRLANEGI